MIQEVKLQGLTHSPSDYISLDGELGTCLNLINEDGELRPIHVPTIVDGSITIPDGATVELVHKVTHNSVIHSQYIVRNSDDTWYWIERGGDGTAHPIDLSGFHVNAVTAVGNILSFVGDNNIMYAYWKEKEYKVFSKENFKYSISFEITHLDYGPYIADMGDEFFDCLKYYNSGDEKRILGMLATGTRKAFNAVEAMVNKKLSELGNRYFSGLVFGVAAVRLYDNDSHVNISNIFALTPYRLSNEIKFAIKGKGGEPYNSHEKFFSMRADTYQADILAKMDIEGLEDIVEGIDIYLTSGDYFLNLDIAINEIKDPEGGITDASATNGTFVIPRITGEKLYSALESKSFYHSIFIPKEDFGKRLHLEKPIQTEDSISLAEPNRVSFGAKCSITYNNRLHLANVNKGGFDLFSFFTTRSFQDVLFMSNPIPSEPPQEIGSYVDIPYVNGIANIAGRTVDCIVAITGSEKSFYKGDIQYPISPIISVPMTDASKIDLYIKLDGKYFHKSISLHKSNNWGFNYYLNIVNGEMSYLQVNDVSYNMDLIVFTPSYTRNSQFEEITEEVWSEMIEKCKNDQSVKETPSLIKISEAENPLVFPAKNSVQVGSSIISALASNTQPISEGQFGEAPLYAFTDEGVWVLMTSTEGTYTARQPANRDVCTNPKGILQIDDAVLYPTDRGIMLQQGKQSTCITDSLDGFPFDFTKVYNQSKTNYNYPSQVLAIKNISDSSVQYVRFRDYMNGADMIYDYYDNRIIVFNTSYAYAYVYSLKSKMWGTMQNVFRSRVNIYPESYAVGKDGKILDVYVKSPSEDMNYIICTRPLSLNAKGIHKTMYTCIARGYARDGEQGKYGIVIFGSNDLFRWYYVGSSSTQYCRGMAGSPFKYFRVAIIGSLSVDETIDSLIVDIQPRWQNKVR